jgi:PKD repeat protein
MDPKTSPVPSVAAAFSCFLALVLVAGAASATTIVMPTDDVLIEKSPVIVRGLVVSSEAIDRNGAIWTESTIRVEHAFKGEVTGDVVVREIGGIVGDRVTRIFGAPEYAAGERVLAFLNATPRGDYQTVDLYVGKLTEGMTLDGRRMWVRERADDVILLSASFEPLPDGNLQRSADEFESFIADRVRGRRSQVAYEVENPVLRRPAQPAAGKLRQKADFTMISEPEIYRWSSFDNGGSATWQSYGTQPGYNGGGVEEVKTAMAAWTGFAGAKIRYVYGGSFTSAPAGLERRNGINEILFADPLNEIAGTFDPRTGGVVGQGGFNAVSGSANWNGPFAADAQHGNSTYRAYNITEGNLTIQDGVSGANGMSSNRLAEIISHEFGHTLGFGHSLDAGALMYKSVSGLGPQLRADDQTAASWLYPNGSGTPAPAPVTIPTAPSALVGTVSGTAVQLRWQDNSSNESGFSIYYATGNSNFAKAGDVASNQASAGISGLSAGASYRFYVASFNSAGASSGSNTVTVTLAAAPAPVPVLSASFTFSPANPLAGDAITFSDRSTGGATGWQWSFGDGTTSTQQNPVKQYSAAGAYTITLTVSRGSERASSSQSISVGASIPVLPPNEPYRSLVSAAAQSNGVGGSVWRTELTLFNAGPEPASVEITFVPGAGGTAYTRSLFLATHQSRTYANALLDIFGMASGSGALAIDATSPTASAVLRVSSRTFNNGLTGTYGQGIPDVGSASMARTLFITGITSTDEYRTNVGLVNRSDNAVAVTLTLLADDGRTVSTANVIVAGDSFQQGALSTYFPTVAGLSYPVLSMQISSAAADAVSAYASVIDNRTQDPIYIQGVPQSTGTSMTIPIVGRSPGANNTFWRSDVTLFNPSTAASGQAVLLTYRPVGGSTQMRSVRVAPRATTVIADIVREMGFDSGNGMLELSWSGTAPVATSRTYTSTPSGATYGQSIDPVEAFGRESYVTGLRSDVSFRSNIGFVNSGDDSILVEVNLLNGAGAQLGSTVVAVGAKGLVQYSVSALFPNVTTASLGSFTVHAKSGSTKMFAYGSIVDNASGDPVFFAGR